MKKTKKIFQEIIFSSNFFFINFVNYHQEQIFFTQYLLGIAARRCKFTQNGDISPTEGVFPFWGCIPLVMRAAP